MLRFEGGPPKTYISPKKRPLFDQIALAERIVLARVLRPPMTWDEIAQDEGVSKRTLQHFYKRWLDDPGVRPQYQDVRGELGKRLRALEAEQPRRDE
jgi:hypothetical protein